MNTQTDSQTAGAPPGSLHPVLRPLVTLEEATRHWNQATAALDKYPEARRFHEYRKRWSKQNKRRAKLESQAAAAKEKEREMWSELQAMKAALPPDAREALC